MRYSRDLRKRALDFITSGGSQSEAERIFRISRRTLYNWLHSADAYAYQKPGPKKPRKLDWGALKTYVERHPDLMLKEYAAHFDVSPTCIFHACNKMQLAYKKRRGATMKQSGTRSAGDDI